MQRNRWFATALFFFLTGFYVFAQERQITGRITSSEDGSSLPGVAVVVKGTTIGTMTDMDGKFVLSVPADAKMLEFRFVGMKTKEAILGESGEVNVVLDSDVMKLDEVVVTALGIKQEKKRLGYSVQELSAKELSKTGESNIVNSLSSKVAGVQVISSSGAPGSSAYIKIRGSTSLTGENQPLFVVDGVPIDNSSFTTGPANMGVANSNRAVDINPDDIESVTVLKGPSAAALYGIRAANGAVLITTKKGKANKGKKIDVSYSTSVAFDRVNKLPALQKKYAQGSNGKYLTTSPYSWGPLLDTMRYDASGNIVGQSDPNATSARLEPFDNAKDFFYTGVTSNNSLSLSGGNEDAVYYFSASRLTQKGVVPLNTFQKTSIRIAGETRLTDKIKTSGSANYVRSGGRRVQQGSNFSALMLGLLRTPPSYDLTNKKDNPVDDPLAYSYPDGTQRTYYSSYDNPYWTVNKNPFTDDVNRLIGNVAVGYEACKWLSLSYRVGTDFYSDRRKEFIDIGSNTVTTKDGRITEDQHFVRTFNSDLIATVTHKVYKDINGTFILGNNLYSNYHEVLFAQGTGLTIPEYDNMANAKSFTSQENIYRKRTAAHFLNTRFDYKSMLYLDLSGRMEWSTTLPASKNNFFYPSASAAFVFSELLKLSENKYFPYGKLRVSYAQVGNDAPLYSTSSYYVTTAYSDPATSGGALTFPVNNVSAFSKSKQLGSTNLKPERTSSFEVGADLRFLQNRLGVDVTYYVSTSKDQIFAVPVAASSGYTTAIQNAGKVENKGIEVIVNGSPLKTKKIEWNVVVNISKNTSNVLELAPGVTSLVLPGGEGATGSFRGIAGEPYGVIYGKRWLRDADGRMVIDTATGYPIIDPQDGVLGNPNPAWLMGVRNSVTYKGFVFSFLFDIRKGGDVMNGTKVKLVEHGVSSATENRGESVVFDGVKGYKDTQGNYVVTGDVNDKSVVLNQAWYTGTGSLFQIENFVEDASWVRLREVSLSYTLNPQWLRIKEKKIFSSMEVYVIGRNLWLNTKYTGIDPETNLTGNTNVQGSDYYNLPNTKSYAVGLRITL